MVEGPELLLVESLVSGSEVATRDQARQLSLGMQVVHRFLSGVSQLHDPAIDLIDTIHSIHSIHESLLMSTLRQLSYLTRILLHCHPDH